jgi:hypothetical protein
MPNVETIDDVMVIVREYSSFFNYQILQNIIDHLKKSSHILAGFAEYAKRKVYECPCEVGRFNEAG